MMQSTLEFDTFKVKVSPWQHSATVPFLSSLSILQNNLIRDLPEGDALAVGYGTIGTYYPYTQQNLYSRDLSEEAVEIAVLENAFLKATFVPSLGGKLWSLYDKVAKKELLYVNDVMRPSNLAVRNAWMSGGVEWNIGVIGHSPFTCEQLFVGRLDVEGMPVLRFYEYERIRKVTYQMDFFLPDDSHYLLCRMQIVNSNTEEIPMYWWSNIAIPKQEKGRLVVGADEAYTSSAGRVYKVGVPKVNGIDLSYPAQIPNIVDYFFDVPLQQRKYITQLDETGYGMIQTSTSRLQGRKLFVWGNKRGSERWQSYLTENAGPYVEIQAGLAKTQYGCLPMPPESEWEWLEAYGPIKVSQALVDRDWKLLRKHVEAVLEEGLPEQSLEDLLIQSKEKIAQRPCKVEKPGSLFGAIENLRRKLHGEKSLSSHLDFGEAVGCWKHLLDEGTLGKHEVDLPPESYMADVHYEVLLEKAIQGRDHDNWYSWYHLGLMKLVKREVREGIHYLEQALEIEESAFILHSLAFAYYEEGNQHRCIAMARKALEIRSADLGMVKDLLGLLLRCKAYGILEECAAALPEDIRSNSRVKACRIEALAYLEKVQEAKRLLYDGSYLEVEDIREGECLTGEIWRMIEPEASLPEELDFNAGF